MKKTTFAKNMYYALIYQIITMAFPIIVSPYITRVLGVNNYGKVSYTTSLINIFVIFAVFGTNIYGVKILSKINNNKEKVSEFISSLMTFKFIVSIVVLIVYLILCVTTFNDDLLLLLVQGILVIANCFAVDWVFQSFENYKYISIRTSIIKIISLVLIFTLVRGENDYVIYAGILTVSTFLSYFISYLFVKKEFNIKPVKFTKVKELLKPLSLFLVISIASSIYALIDTVILKNICDDYSVGIYSLAKTVVVSITSITMTISTVVLPKSNYLFVNDKEKYREILNYSYNLLMFFSIPLFAGTVFFAEDIVLLLGGVEYISARYLVYIMSLLIVIVAMWTWNYYQRAIPNEKEKHILKIQLSMLFLVVIFNVLLDKKFSFYGSSIAYLIAELFGFISITILLKKCDNFKYLNSSIIKYFFASLLMFTVMLVFRSFLINNIIVLFIVGSLVYCITLLIFKEEMLLSFIDKIKGVIKGGLNEKNKG